MTDHVFDRSGVVSGIGRGAPRFFAAGLIAVLILGLGPSEAWAQEGPAGRLTGRVVEASSGDPLPKATVALWRRTEGDSTLVAGTVTGPKGRFELTEIPVQVYRLRISYVGYETLRRSDVRPAPSSNAADLGTLRLVRTTAVKEGVEVTADRPAARMKTDRNVYNTSERALSAGGSARSVLEDLPSIRVDMDGSISYRGNESVSVHINGEPASLQGQSLLSYLESLSASAVKRVEVIPNPSAKYEPSGMSGIINIVLHQNLKNKWSGGVTLGAERDANNRYGGNGSVNVGYQSGGWRLVGTYSHRRDSEEDTDSRLVEQFNENGPSSWVKQTGRQTEQERSHSLRTEVGYSFDGGTSLKLETSLSLRRDEETGRNEYWEYTGERRPENLTDHYVRRVDNASSDESFDGRLDFTHDFSDDHTLSAQLRYDRDLESEDGTYRVYGFQNGTQLDTAQRREGETMNEDEQDGSLKIDYSRPLGPISLEAGYKGSMRRLDNERVFEGTESAFTFDEEIHAAYGILSKGLGAFTLEAGLRTEYVTTTINRVEDVGATKSSYVSFYPSAFLTYKPNQKRQARLSYSKRVDRPSLWDINPLEDNENPTFIEKGNPGLDPEYIHSFELSMTQRWSTASVSVTPYLRHTVNQIEEVRRDSTTAGGETVVVRQSQNLSSSTSYGTELVATFNYGDRIEGTLSGNLYRSVTDGSNLTTDLSQDAVLFSGRANLRAKLMGGLQLELSQFYRPARDIPPQGHIDRFTSTELAFQQELFGGDGSLTLRVDDLFNNTSMNMWYRDNDIYQQSTSQWGAREVSLSFQYTFGSGTDDERDQREYDDYR
ncbi:MAG: TonB-dependent receptor domain-containing protein [Salinibacter sp.]